MTVWEKMFVDDAMYNLEEAKLCLKNAIEFRNGTSEDIENIISDIDIVLQHLEESIRGL